jgi:hypothetical protein
MGTPSSALPQSGSTTILKLTLRVCGLNLSTVGRKSSWAHRTSSVQVFKLRTRDRRKLLHTWIRLVIVKQHLVQIGRIDGSAEYLSQILVAVQLVEQNTLRESWRAALFALEP